MSEKERLDKYSKKIVDSVFEKIENDKCDFTFIDEEPPEEVIFECLMRRKALGLDFYEETLKKIIDSWY